MKRQNLSVNLLAEAQHVTQDVYFPRIVRREYAIQESRVTGIQAACHVAEDFAYHASQIITKLRTKKDLGLTRLPGERKRQRALPAV